MSSGRFNVLAQPSAAPGHCFLCRSTVNGPFIDTGMSVQWEGAIYICAGCITDMANQLPKSASDDVEYRLAKAYSEGAAATADKAKALFDDLGTRLLHGIGLFAPMPVEFAPVEVVSDDAGDSADSADGDAGSIDAPGQDGSVNIDKRSNRVPVDSGDELGLEL